jgi:DNA modification methylase
MASFKTDISFLEKVSIGAIPPNLLQIPNTESSSQYLRYCKTLGLRAHPARFPPKLPEFFIKFLTEPNDLVLDIFAGSNTTGRVAEQLERQWLAFDVEHEYLAQSVFRFLENSAEEEVKELYERLQADEVADVRLISNTQISLLSYSA